MNYLNFIFLAALSALRQLPRNPTLQRQVRNVLLQLRDAITLIYEPAELQGVQNRKIDAARFIEKAVATNTGAVLAQNYTPGSFQFGDEDGDGIPDDQDGDTSSKKKGGEA